MEKPSTIRKSTPAVARFPRSKISKTWWEKRGVDQAKIPSIKTMPSLPTPNEDCNKTMPSSPTSNESILRSFEVQKILNYFRGTKKLVSPIHSPIRTKSPPPDFDDFAAESTVQKKKNRKRGKNSKRRARKIMKTRKILKKLIGNCN